MDDLAILFDRGNQQRAQELDRLCEQKWEVAPIKHKFAWKRFAKYLLRWQASGVILAPCIMYLPCGAVGKTVAANLLGGCAFYFVDRWIFKGDK